MNSTKLVAMESNLKRNNIMNDDVLKLILEYLSVKEKIRLERCSKQFMSCIKELLLLQNGLRISHENSENFCHHKKHSTYNANICDAIFVRHSSRGCCRYRTFDIFSSKENLENILRKCPNIRSLELIECEINYEIIEWLSDKCRKLGCFKLYLDKELEEEVWERIGNKIGDKLFHFYIQAHNIETKGLVNLMKNLSIVEELAISSYRSSFCGLPLKSLLQLRKLSLFYCYIDAESIGILSQLKNLTHLYVNNFYDENIANQLLDSICTNLTKLESLSIDDIQYSSLSPLNKLENLEALEISLSESFDDKTAQFKNLKSLTLKRTLLTLKILDYIANNFKRLEKLTFNDVDYDCKCAHISLGKCLKCQESCEKYLSQLSISHLKIEDSLRKNRILLYFIPSSKKLKTIEVIRVSENNNEVLLDLSKYLANQKKNNVLTLITDSKNLMSMSKGLDVPKNLRIVNKIY